MRIVMIAEIDVPGPDQGTDIVPDVHRESGIQEGDHDALVQHIWENIETFKPAQFTLTRATRADLEEFAENGCLLPNPAPLP